MKLASPLVVCCALAAAAFTPARAQTDLFRGKEISLLIGAGAGGGADSYARVLAPYLARHLPGNPSVVAKNLPGAGGLRLANQLYNVSPKDGTELGILLISAALEPLFGNKGAKFETMKFTWIGNMDSDPTVCFGGSRTGIKTWRDLKNRVTTFGASGPASTASIQTRIMGALLGVKVKMIHGYQGTQTSYLAIQRGELDGVCGIYMTTVRSRFVRLINAGEMNVWITLDRERTKDFPDVPSIYELLKNDDDRKLADLIYGQNAIGRPILAPPGLSPQVTAALRKGLRQAMADPGFLAEVKKAHLQILPMSGEETERRLRAFYELPGAVIARAKRLLGR